MFIPNPAKFLDRPKKKSGHFRGARKSPNKNMPGLRKGISQPEKMGVPGDLGPDKILQQEMPKRNKKKTYELIKDILKLSACLF
jgi:hypothetical protein